MTGRGTPLSRPEPLHAAHDLARFDSGVPALDEWLRRRALRNQESGASRTYVVRAGQEVVAYDALAAGSVAQAAAPGRLRRNMPDPVPVVVLARLAVARGHQGRGLGRALLRDAVLRTLAAADVIGVRGLLVNAISDEARAFYERHGFAQSPLDPMVLMITLADAAAACE